MGCCGDGSLVAQDEKAASGQFVSLGFPPLVSQCEKSISRPHRLLLKSTYSRSHTLMTLFDIGVSRRLFNLGGKDVATPA